MKPHGSVSVYVSFFEDTLLFGIPRFNVHVEDVLPLCSMVAEIHCVYSWHIGRKGPIIHPLSKSIIVIIGLRLQVCSILHQRFPLLMSPRCHYFYKWWFILVHYYQKGKWSCMSHPISNFVISDHVSTTYYSNISLLSPFFPKNVEVIESLRLAGYYGRDVCLNCYGT